MARKAPETTPAPDAALDTEPCPPPTECPELECECREQMDEIATLKLQLLEQDALVEELRGQNESRQQALDEAIREVVRAKAKQRSQETRAEAASEMAEAEIALKSLEESGSKMIDKELSHIRELVKQSSWEFDKENFSGSLYLSNQAKGRINLARSTIRSAENVEDNGETPFARPLRLTTLKPSRVRISPALGTKVLKTVEAGSTVTGVAHKGEWIKVLCYDGTRGWIHRTLVEKGSD